MKVAIRWTFRVLLVLFCLGTLSAADQKNDVHIVNALFVVAIAVYFAGRAIADALDRLPR